MNTSRETVYFPNRVQSLSRTAVAFFICAYFTIAMTRDSGLRNPLIMVTLLPFMAAALTTAVINLANWFLKLPRLIVTADALHIKTLFKASWIKWDSLGTFTQIHKRRTI